MLARVNTKDYLYAQRLLAVLIPRAIDLSLPHTFAIGTQMAPMACVRSQDVVLMTMQILSFIGYQKRIGSVYFFNLALCYENLVLLLLIVAFTENSCRFYLTITIRLS